MRLRSARPSRKAVKTTQAAPPIMVGNNGMKYSPASTPSAAIARVAGPPQGLKPLMMLSDNMAMVARIIGFMPMRLYNGSIAAQVIM
ncbi:hypothetical protein D3C75_1000490 [compost metagenome]